LLSTLRTLYSSASRCCEAAGTSSSYFGIECAAVVVIDRSRKPQEQERNLSSA